MSIFDRFKGRGAVDPEVTVKSIAPEHAKENPVSAVDAGYFREQYAPYCKKLLLEQLQRHPLAFMCLRMIAWQAAQARMVAYDVDGEINEEITAILDNPNPDMSGEEYRRMMYLSLGGIGDAFSTEFNNAQNQLEEIWPIRADNMVEHTNQRGALTSWSYQPGNGRKKILQPEQVMHIKHGWIDMGTWGVGSASPLHAALKYWDGYHDWNNSLLDGAQGVSEILALDSDEPLPEKAFEDIMRGLGAFKLAAQQGKVGSRMMLNAKVKSVSRGVNPSELQVTEWFDRLTKSILNGFQVPPILLNIGEGITYENQRQARLSFWEDTLIPGYVNILAGGLSRFLGVTVKADLSGVPAIADAQCDRAVKVSSISHMTINEKRKTQGLPPVDGGDIIYIDANKLPIDFNLSDDGNVERSIDAAAAKRGIHLVK